MRSARGTTPRTEDAVPASDGTSFQTAIFLLSGPLGPSAGLLALTEYRPDGGNRSDQPDESECRTDSLSLLYTEAVREKWRDPRADHSPRGDDECQFWAR